MVTGNVRENISSSLLNGSTMGRKKSKSSSRTKASKIPVNHNGSTPVAHITQQQFSGPVPHPQILQEYEQILPGAAERILSMAEKDAEHQRTIEMEAITLAGDESRRGQTYGFSIGITAFITSIVALLLGSEKTAMALGGTTLFGLVAVFVTGRIIQNTPQNDKQKD